MEDYEEDKEMSFDEFRLGQLSFTKYEEERKREFIIEEEEGEEEEKK